MEEDLAEFYVQFDITGEGDKEAKDDSGLWV